MKTALLRPVLICCVVGGAVLYAESASGSASTSTVLKAVQASVSIDTVPSNLSPSITYASNNLTSPKVTGANYIKPSCNPYTKHNEATKPIPCFYGDKSARKTVVLYGDSASGDWAPALSNIFAGLHLRLALFGFFGCTTAPVTETSTSQPGFPGEWQLCNKWHRSLPAAVRRLKPVAIISASSPWPVVASEAADWASAMSWDYKEMTIGNSRALRIVMGATPLYPNLIPQCLATSPSAVQTCSLDYSSASSWYRQRLQRDKDVAAATTSVLIPAYQWFCYNDICSPIIGKYMACVDRDHSSTAYVEYIEGALRSSLLSKLKFP